MGQVEEARLLLMDYNSRLTAELDERKRVAIMLHNFIAAQKEAITRAERKLQVGHRTSNSNFQKQVFKNTNLENYYVLRRPKLYDKILML